MKNAVTIWSVGHFIVSNTSLLKLVALQFQWTPNWHLNWHLKLL